MLVLLHESGGRHDQARGAKTALYGARIDIGLLDPGELTVPGLTLHRADGLSVRPHGQGDAGIHRNVIQQDRAGTAFADAAALLGTGDAKVSQRFQQRLAHIHRKKVLRAVNGTGNVLLQ